MTLYNGEQIFLFWDYFVTKSLTIASLIFKHIKAIHRHCFNYDETIYIRPRDNPARGTELASKWRLVALIYSNISIIYHAIKEYAISNFHPSLQPATRSISSVRYVTYIRNTRLSRANLQLIWQKKNPSRGSTWNSTRTRHASKNITAQLP